MRALRTFLGLVDDVKREALWTTVRLNKSQEPWRRFENPEAMKFPQFWKSLCYRCNALNKLVFGDQSALLVRKNVFLIFIFYFRERRREGETEGQKHASVGPNPQHGLVVPARESNWQWNWQLLGFAGRSPTN